MRLKNGPIEGETWVTSKVRDIYSNTSFDFPETPANCSNERKQMDPFPNAVFKLKGLNVKNPVDVQNTETHESCTFVIDIDIRVNQIINMDGRYVEHLILIIIIEIDNQYGW